MEVPDSSSSETSYLAVILFFLEFYHFLAHACVLLRIRLLPRKDLVRQRYYFLADTCTVAMTNFVFTGKLRWLAALQMCQHFFFFFTWNEHPYTKKVISWSSLDWTFSIHAKGWHFDLVLGTLFDTLVHVVNSYLLSTYLTNHTVLITAGVATTFFVLLFSSTRFAWSSPSNVPKWVQKRVQQVEEDKYAALHEPVQIGLFLTGVALMYNFFCLNN